VFGDSFTRGTASELLHNPGSAFEFIGYVKPGPGLEVITNMTKKEISTLTKEGMIVIWGGTNDIEKMKQITFSHILQIL
jgi:hypothetical protein